MINPDVIYKVDIVSSVSSIDILTLIIGFLSFAASTVLSILVYRLTKNIGKQQKDMQKYSFKIELFDKRLELFQLIYELFTLIGIYDNELKNKNGFIPKVSAQTIEEYLYDLYNYLTLSKFLFNEDISIIISKLYELIGDVQVRLDFFAHSNLKADEILNKIELVKSINAAIDYYKSSEIIEKLSSFLELSFEDVKQDK